MVSGFVGPERSWVEDQCRRSELHRIQTLFFLVVRGFGLNFRYPCLVVCLFAVGSRPSREDAFSKVTEFNGATWRWNFGLGKLKCGKGSVLLKFVPACRTPVCNDVAVQFKTCWQGFGIMPFAAERDDSSMIMRWYEMIIQMITWHVNVVARCLCCSTYGKFSHVIQHDTAMILNFFVNFWDPWQEKWTRWVAKSSCKSSIYTMKGGRSKSCHGLKVDELRWILVSESQWRWWVYNVYIIYDAICHKSETNISIITSIMLDWWSSIMLRGELQVHGTEGRRQQTGALQLWTSMFPSKYWHRELAQDESYCMILYVYIYIFIQYDSSFAHIASIWGEAPLSKDAQMALDMFIYLYTMKLGLVWKCFS